jgi:hypothetical protein
MEENDCGGQHIGLRNRVNTICVLWLEGGVSWADKGRNLRLHVQLEHSLDAALFLVELEHLLETRMSQMATFRL